MTYPKMKPCPKCGEPVACYTYDGTGASRVECDARGCWYIGPIGNKVEAIRGHNERALQPSKE